MRDRLCGWLFLAGVTTVTIPAAVAQDRIRFIDRATKKESVAVVNIQEESPSRISYKAGTSGAVKEFRRLADHCRGPVVGQAAVGERRCRRSTKELRAVSVERRRPSRHQTGI